MDILQELATDLEKEEDVVADYLRSGVMLKIWRNGS